MQSTLNSDPELFHFLNNAPKEFSDTERIRKFQLKNGDFIHCILWNYHFYITGTDIVKILVWRFQNSGRTITSLKKFEEGVFSDLRNLKPGIDSTLESPRSAFLEFLYKNGSIRTQKKQKVFFWYSVPHDALFCDALERDLRRETNLYTYNKYMSEINKNVRQRPVAEEPRKRVVKRPQNSVYDQLFEKKSIFSLKETPPARTRSSVEDKLFGVDDFYSRPPPSPKETKKQRKTSTFDYTNFDLTQLDFLKDRCSEWAFDNKSCHKKEFKDNTENKETPKDVNFISELDK